MRRSTSIALALAAAVALAAVPFAAAGGFAAGGVQGDGTTGDVNASDDGVRPGERLAGVVGVQGAELHGEVAERSHGVAVANAETDQERADVVAERVAAADARLDELETRLDELEAAREAGEIGEGRYRAEVATIEAETRAVERQVAAAAATADGLPADVLRERGVDAASIREVRERASSLGGPETAEIARSIAGDSVGEPVTGDRDPGAPIDAPGNGAGPDRAENRTAD
ncbi:hypothetical protein [Salinilacihabitans rarus]|uniref:hypothetical protein n=1 Tax=Salinilacihabitans rarus TaxID=2961596 RepID=UPI0020C8CA49|nr:hypothetical protein [Salinilacihabitans rarus]